VEYSLLDAVGRNNMPKAQQALASGASVDCSDSTGRTPLMLAAAEGYKDMVVWLLRQGGRINARDKRNSYALREAILNQHFEVRDLLMQAGAEVADLDRLELGKQLCSKAAEGNIEGVRHLLDSRASVNAVGYDLRSALHLSAAEGHHPIVALLLDRRADPALKDRFGGTALGDAARGNHTKVMDLLRAAQGPLLPLPNPSAPDGHR
jgi:ankyrin repeat protein